MPTMADIHNAIDDAIDAPSLKDSFRPLKYGELPGGGSEMAAAVHEEDAQNQQGIFDPKYDNLQGIDKMRNNVMRGRDNEDDGDGTDEDADWTPQNK